MATYLITKNGDPEPLGLSLYSPGAAAPYGQELFPFDCIDSILNPFGTYNDLTRTYMIIPNGTFTAAGIATWWSVTGSSQVRSVLYQQNGTNPITLLASSALTTKTGGVVQKIDFTTPVTVEGDKMYYIGFSFVSLDTSFQMGYLSGRLTSSATPFPCATDPNGANALPSSIGIGQGASLSHRPWMQIYGL